MCFVKCWAWQGCEGTADLSCRKSKDCRQQEMWLWRSSLLCSYNEIKFHCSEQTHEGILCVLVENIIVMHINKLHQFVLILLFSVLLFTHIFQSMNSIIVVLLMTYSPTQCVFYSPLTKLSSKNFYVGLMLFHFASHSFLTCFCKHR